MTAALGSLGGSKQDRILGFEEALSRKKYLSGDRAYLLWSAVSANICFLIGDYPRPKSHGPGALSSFAKNSEN